MQSERDAMRVGLGRAARRQSRGGGAARETAAPEDPAAPGGKRTWTWTWGAEGGELVSELQEAGCWGEGGVCRKANPL